ncbi:MAG TPA: 50S ribosomal protein L11 methyltransferase, partial [candidate division Zixibacteria bacterium]|nr:50S ribosomal protein L11 methyltransferase [candidate division Zixibacteria bacterium]
MAMVRGYVVQLLGADVDPGRLVTATEIRNRAWEEEYRRSVQPVVIGDIVIRPPWAPAPIATPYDIVIEPKMAFGTGTHETTRSCLRIIRQHLQPGGRVLDLGCGSGILSILADKMGAGYIKAIDYDVTAIDNCRENFRRNAVAAPHDILFGSIGKCRGDRPYDLAVANIIKSTILEMLPRLVELTGRPGHLVLSGLLEQDVPEVAAGLDRLGAADRAVLPDNEWRTITITFA